MTVEELRAIANLCDIEPSMKVKVTVKMPDGTIKSVDVDSFKTYSDALVFNVKV